MSLLLNKPNPLNPNAIGAAASLGSVAVDLANIGAKKHGHLKFDGYKADGAAAGITYGSALGPVGMLGGALAGTAFDLISFSKRKKAFEQEKQKMQLNQWRNNLNTNDFTGQY